VPFKNHKSSVYAGFSDLSAEVGIEKIVETNLREGRK